MKSIDSFPDKSTDTPDRARGYLSLISSPEDFKRVPDNSILVSSNGLAAKVFDFGVLHLTLYAHPIVEFQTVDEIPIKYWPFTLLWFPEKPRKS